MPKTKKSERRSDYMRPPPTSYELNHLRELIKNTMLPLVDSDKLQHYNTMNELIKEDRMCIALYDYIMDIDEK